MIAGTNPENINFKGKAITIVSAEGPAFTTIDGGSADSAVVFNSQRVGFRALWAHVCSVQHRGDRGNGGVMKADETG